MHSKERTSLWYFFSIIRIEKKSYSFKANKFPRKFIKLFATDLSLKTGPTICMFGFTWCILDHALLLILKGREHLYHTCIIQKNILCYYLLDLDASNFTTKKQIRV